MLLRKSSGWKLGRSFKWKICCFFSMGKKFATKREKEKDNTLEIIYAAMLFSQTQYFANTKKTTNKNRTWTSHTNILHSDLVCRNAASNYSPANVISIVSSVWIPNAWQHFKRISIIISIGLFTLPVTAGCWRKSLAIMNFHFEFHLQSGGMVVKGFVSVVNDFWDWNPF